MDYPDKIREAKNESGILANSVDLPYPAHGERWGEWEFDAEDLVLVHVTATDRRNYYEVDLEDMTSSAKVLGWICHVSHKAWATAQVVGDLVKAIDDLIRPQTNVCSGGAEPFNPSAFIRKHIRSGKRARHYES